MNFIEADVCGHAKTVTNGLDRLFKIATTFPKRKKKSNIKTEFQPWSQFVQFERKKKHHQQQQQEHSPKTSDHLITNIKVLLRIVPEAPENKPKMSREKHTHSERKRE